jgi:transcriptional regulator with PAS, ATPase and Fis domain
LIDHFVRKFNRLNGKEIQGVSSEVLRIMMSHDFPGNIRELENIIEYATVVCKNSLIQFENLPDHLQQKAEGHRAPVDDSSDKKGISWQEMERSLIYEALRQNEWNRTATAAQMGVHPTTLWRKIKRLNIEPPDMADRSKGTSN